MSKTPAPACFASQAFLALYLSDRAAEPAPAPYEWNAALFADLGWARDELDPIDECLLDTVPAPDGSTIPSERGDVVDVVVPRAPRLPDLTSFAWGPDGRVEFTHALPQHTDVELGRIEDQALVGRWARGGVR